jgi:hypothetical protein
MDDDVEEKPAGWCCRWSRGCYGVGVPVVVAGGVERCRECHEEWERETCVVCGGVARDEYEGSPTCGRPACELRVQAAADYHAERSGS